MNKDFLARRSAAVRPRKGRRRRVEPPSARPTPAAKTDLVRLRPELRREHGLVPEDQTGRELHDQRATRGRRASGYDGFYAATEDDLNVRFHRMEGSASASIRSTHEPLHIAGFTQLRCVPDREGGNNDHGERERPAPDLELHRLGEVHEPALRGPAPCEQGATSSGNLPRSTRSPDLIFFAVVGGVPEPAPALQPRRRRRPPGSASRRTTGRRSRQGLRHFDTRASTRMIQSVKPREELVKTGGDPNLPRGQNGDDKVHGREWNTKKKDLQYACTFDLPRASASAGNFRLVRTAR